MLYRFSHKTGAYGVTIKEENDDQVLVQVQQAITKMENDLKQQNTEFAKQALNNLENLKNDYSIQYKQKFL